MVVGPLTLCHIFLCFYDVLFLHQHNGNKNIDTETVVAAVDGRIFAAVYGRIFYVSCRGIFSGGIFFVLSEGIFVVVHGGIDEMFWTACGRIFGGVYDGKSGGIFGGVYTTKLGGVFTAKYDGGIGGKTKNACTKKLLMTFARTFNFSSQNHNNTTLNFAKFLAIVSATYPCTESKWSEVVWYYCDFAN